MQNERYLQQKKYKQLYKRIIKIIDELYLLNKSID